MNLRQKLRLRFLNLRLVSLLLVFLPGFRFESGVQQKVWVTSTFLDFLEGTLVDGGANTYISAAGEVLLINQWDLNNDGHLDIVFPNSHDNNQQIDLFIYWGVEGFHVDHRTRLPSDGGVAQAIADLNGDGYLDLVVANDFNGVKTNLNSYIYWGSGDGFDAQRRTELPTVGAQAAAVADLNGDGHPDLVFANSGKAYEGLGKQRNYSYIYWGSREGFAQKNLLSLPTATASDVKLADLNRDGVLEIVFANEGTADGDSGAMIYWGSNKENYSENRRTNLPGRRSSALAISDLNADRWPEIILANRYRPIKRKEGETSEIDTDVDSEAIHSYVYWGSPSGYSERQRTELPTVAASGVSAGDLNGDGYVDIVFSNGPRRAGHAAPSPGGGSYIYWGGPQGFEVRRRSILPTLNPTDCLIDDLNGDGYPDLVFSNDNDARSFNASSYVYWGSARGFSADRRLELPTLGAASAGVGDFNRDGKKDLVFINRVDGLAGAPVPAYLYWGNEKGEYSSDNRQSLPHPYGSPGEGYAAADVNNDGFVDLYLGGPESAIYWGSRQGFSAANKTVISPRMAFSARLADFDQDGYLDALLSEFATGGETDLYWGGPMGFSENNRFTFRIDGVRFQSIADLDGNGYLDVAFPTVNGKVSIFWNGPGGFDNERKSVLPAGLATAVEVADLNADGYLDVIVCSMRSSEGQPQGNTFIYWGSDSGYAESRRLVLPSVGTADVLVADLNRDHHLDLVLSSYHAQETRSHPSYIYWNGPQGFDPSRVTLLPTHSASGVLAADFNRDGHLDVLFACHTREGSHRNDSFLYWGGPQGYSTERRTLLPGLGPHFLTATDIGNVHDRSDRYDYISRPFDAGSPVQFETLEWEGETPFRTRLEFQVRAAQTRETLATAAWQGPDGPNSFFRKSPSELSGMPPDARWIQFKAILVSPDDANTPVLESVSVTYRGPVQVKQGRLQNLLQSIAPSAEPCALEKTASQGNGALDLHHYALARRQIAHFKLAFARNEGRFLFPQSVLRIGRPG